MENFAAIEAAQHELRGLWGFMQEVTQQQETIRLELYQGEHEEMTIERILHHKTLNEVLREQIGLQAMCRAAIVEQEEGLEALMRTDRLCHQLLRQAELRLMAAAMAHIRQLVKERRTWKSLRRWRLASTMRTWRSYTSRRWEQRYRAQHAALEKQKLVERELAELLFAKPLGEADSEAQASGSLITALDQAWQDADEESSALTVICQANNKYLEATPATTQEQCLAAYASALAECACESERPRKVKFLNSYNGGSLIQARRSVTPSSRDLGKRSSLARAMTPPATRSTGSAKKVAPCKSYVRCEDTELHLAPDSCPEEHIHLANQSRKELPKQWQKTRENLKKSKRPSSPRPWR